MSDWSDQVKALMQRTIQQDEAELALIRGGQKRYTLADGTDCTLAEEARLALSINATRKALSEAP